jgi:hypothetical protein
MRQDCSVFIGFTDAATIVHLSDICTLLALQVGDSPGTVSAVLFNPPVPFKQLDQLYMKWTNDSPVSYLFIQANFIIEMSNNADGWTRGYMAPLIPPLNQAPAGGFNGYCHPYCISGSS